MSKVKKVAGVTGERNTKRSSVKKAKASLPKATGQRKRKSVRAGAAKKSASVPTRTRAKGPMKKPGKGSRTTVSSGRGKAVASGVKNRRSKDGRSGKTGLSLVRGRKPVSDAPVVVVAVKALDPLRKCGPNTTVQLLYRVDESVGGRRTAHLVFFDRHGWYCEHGRTCPAVGHAKKHNGRIARVS